MGCRSRNKESVKEFEEASLIMKDIDCGFIPKCIDIKVEGHYIKIRISAIEGKSYKTALVGKPQNSEEEDDDLAAYSPGGQHGHQKRSESAFWGKSDKPFQQGR